MVSFREKIIFHKIKKRSIANLLIMVFLISMIGALTSAIIPSSALSSYPPDPTNNIANYLPVIKQPTSDINNGNGIEKVYYYVERLNPGNPSYAYRIEISIIFYDEDDPLRDEEYDRERIDKYGNIKDIETIHFYVDWSGHINRLQFYRIWSGSISNWNFGRHSTGDRDYFYAGRPTIYINTWNHAMSWVDQNGKPDTTLYPGSGYSYAPGDRYDAERDFRNGNKDYQRPKYLLHRTKTAETSHVGPTVAVFQNYFYLAWRGTNNHIYLLRSYDGHSWNYKVKLSDTTYSTPALVAFNGYLYLAWRGTNDHIYIMRSSNPTVSSSWHNKYKSPETTYSSPALAAGSDGRLYLAWRGTDNRLNVQYSYGSTSSWYRKHTLSETSYSAPALAWYNGYIVLAWRGTDNHINFIRSTGGSNMNLWGHKHTFPETTYSAPTLTVVGNDLVVGWRGTDNHLNIAKGYHNLVQKNTFTDVTTDSFALVQKSSYGVLIFTGTNSYIYTAYYG